MDSVSLCGPVTKYSVEVDSPESVSEVMTNAFLQRRVRPPRSRLCESTNGYYGGTCQVRGSHPPAHSGAGPADTAAIKEAARLINQAKRPVVLLGLLASKPQNVAAVHELIESGKLPVVGTFQTGRSGLRESLQ
jgi:acetolactate synthase-1/2/3 large subunit